MLEIEELPEVTVVRLRHGKANALDLELLRVMSQGTIGLLGVLALERRRVYTI